MFVYDGDPATLVFLFKLDGEFVSPSVATYTLRDHAGAKVVAQTDIPITLTGSPTQAVVAISGSYNALAGGSRVENRAVEVSFTVSGNVHRLRQGYQVSQYLNHAVEPRQVRELLGLFDHELGDEEIDLGAAYYAAEAAITKAVMDAAVVATDIVNLNANRLIVAFAAAAVIPSLRLRAQQLQQDENVRHQRLTGIKIEEIANDVAGLIATLTTALTGDDAVTATMMVRASAAGTDVITGQ